MLWKREVHGALAIVIEAKLTVHLMSLLRSRACTSRLRLVQRQGSEPMICDSEYKAGQILRGQIGGMNRERVM